MEQVAQNHVTGRFLIQLIYKFWRQLHHVLTAG